MATNGINSVSDLLAYKFGSAAELGLNTINAVLSADLAYHNSLMNDAVSLLADKFSEQRRVYGTAGAHPMTEVDEFGKAKPKKPQPGVSVEFPLRRFSSIVGWNRTALSIATPAEIAARYIQVRDGHTQEVIRQIKKAIYNNDNYSFVDALTNGVTLNVKRFLNADGDAIPDSPAGVSFDKDAHTHYFGTTGSATAASDMDYLVNHVTEHGNTQGLVVAINLADKASISALTGFRALTPAVLVDNGQDAATIARLNNDDLENQFIGYWRDHAQIWVKPWTVSGYAFCTATGSAEKPLGMRERPQAALQGLRLDAQFEEYPLYAEAFEALFGFGVWNRTNGAVMKLNASGGWSDPTIA